MQHENKILNILGDDIACVELIASMGDDLSVVNSARLSFGNDKQELDAKDVKLIDYLASHNHTSPFRHQFLSLRILAPEFIMRQWYKHVVGCAWGTGDAISHGWNEISQRYTSKLAENFFCPLISDIRGQADNNRQASDDSLSLEEQHVAYDLMASSFDNSVATYTSLIDMGVAREQARIVLPLSTYTEVIWTASLQAVAHFIKLRRHEGAQYEIRKFADAVENLAREQFPNALESLCDHQ